MVVAVLEDLGEDRRRHVGEGNGLVGLAGEVCKAGVSVNAKPWRRRGGGESSRYGQRANVAVRPRLKGRTLNHRLDEVGALGDLALDGVGLLVRGDENDLVLLLGSHRGYVLCVCVRLELV